MVNVIISKRVLRRVLLPAVLLMFCFAFMACSPSFYFRSNYSDVNTLLHEPANLKTKPFLKAHLKNGDVCILRDTWSVDSAKNYIVGFGTRFDFNRNKMFEGQIVIGLDSVAIFETNKKLTGTEDKRIQALSILAGVDVLIGAICLTNPKACFGSCPTFYINEKDDFHYADAEGFSNAIAPSMEYADIDALNNLPLTENTFSLTMKNEALETHCLKDVKLLAYPRGAGERVYQSPKNEFYLCGMVHNLISASASEGDVSRTLREQDRQEWFSLADGDNLSSKEEVFLTFNNIYGADKQGLILNFRQTLMTTYFIYNAMGYMGDELGDMFALLEKESTINDKLKNGIRKELGDIDVYSYDESLGKWIFQGGYYETGPIAINRQILPLSSISGNIVKLKLVLNKGLWRIDYAALTNIKEKVTPVEISPSNILNKGVEDESALRNLSAKDSRLISMPGSEYKFNFQLPQSGKDYELFLYSKGYYLEWMRAHWLKDKNLWKLRQMIEYPSEYLSDEAKEYKMYESYMEHEFWGSRIDTKAFSYEEK